MDKIGVAVVVNKSGVNKDMGSPFRARTAEEDALIQDLTDQLAQRFIKLVGNHRQITPAVQQEIRTARVFLADRALELGLVDEIGYTSDALAAARLAAGLGDDARVVVYRRNEYPDDTVYNSAALGEPSRRTLLDLGLPTGMLETRTGFYYLWAPATGK
jgi:protease-4